MPTLPFNHCYDLILNIILFHLIDIPYFHNSGLYCSLFHQLKLKTALIQANEWKYWMESFRPSDFEHYKLKISFHTEPRSRLWHWGPHISDKIDRKYFIRQWLLVAGLKTNISQRKHFRILPSFVIHRDWNLNGTVWIKNDPEFIISVIYCLCFSSFDKNIVFDKACPEMNVCHCCK